MIMANCVICTAVTRVVNYSSHFFTIRVLVISYFRF